MELALEGMLGQMHGDKNGFLRAAPLGIRQGFLSDSWPGPAQAAGF